MQIKQFEDKGLSQFSYVVFCENEGIAAVVDPQRDVDGYISFAKENNLTIKYIFETHIHADFASGIRELEALTKATLKLSSYDTNETFEYAFPHDALKDGDAVTFGSVKIEAVHTPGHTPEHLSFLVYDVNRDAAQPSHFLSGDFLFLGSLGRPDLLGEDAKLALAKKLYKSVKEKLTPLHDVLEVLPGHGAGSLCGAGMSKAKGSTLGAERETNAYLNPALTEEEFVAKILGTSPPFPQYYLRMKKLNSEGHKVFGTLPLPKVMEANEFMAAHTDGLIVDFREPLSFGAAHIEGSVNIPMGNQPSFWAAWMVQYDTPLYIIAEADTDIENITRCLIRVGLDDIAGYLRGGIKTWVAKGEDFLDIPQVSVRFLDDMMDAGEKVTVIDVRTENEFNEGHVKGAKHIYLGNLKERIGKFNPDDEIYCICGGGSRSAVAASVLQNAGFEMVFNVFGGMSSWKNAGLQVVATQAKENKTVTA